MQKFLNVPQKFSDFTGRAMIFKLGAKCAKKGVGRRDSVALYHQSNGLVVDSSNIVTTTLLPYINELIERSANSTVGSSTLPFQCAHFSIHKVVQRAGRRRHCPWIACHQ